MAHGSAAARCSTADADDAITLTSACLTVTEATAYYVSAYAKKVSGTAVLDINILEDDSADCGSITTTTSVIDDAVPTTSWARQGGTITTGAGIIRAQVQISLPAAAAQSLDIDGVMLVAGATPTDALTTTDTDASAVSTYVNASVANKLTAGAWQIELTARAPHAWSDTGTHYLVYVPGTSGDNNRVDLYYSADVLNLDVYDASGTKKSSTVACATAANTAVAIKAKHTAGGEITACCGAACDASPGTAAIQASQGATMYLGNNNSAGSDVWISGLKIKRRVTP
jgi:hypothetical protein